MDQIKKDVKKLANLITERGIIYDKLFCIPKGGLIVGQILAKELCAEYTIEEEEITDKTLIVDDLIDSGKTLSNVAYAGRDVAVLYRKPTSPKVDYFVEEKTGWIDLPWEKKDKDFEDLIVRLLEHMGEDPAREGLVGTPDRVKRMYEEIFGGYKQDPNKHTKAIFECSNDNMVVIKDIDFWSHCEHHMVPFFGKCHIGYIPDGKVLGLSKFARIVEVFARRLQIQEGLNDQIAEFLFETLKPKGLIVVMEGSHLCMVMRGVKKINSTTLTSSIHGLFKEQAVRNEFFNLIK